MAPSRAFLICFFTSPVARGRNVLYRVSCFESRIENLSVSTLTWTSLTLKTEDVSFGGGDVNRTVPWSQSCKTK